jgi:hypothetical protein
VNILATITKFTNFNITAQDGNTVPSTNISGSTTYIDIGSGTVFKLTWNTPIASNNAVDNYTLYISMYDNSTNTTVVVYNKNIGNVNEFYITSNMLSEVKQLSYRLSITVTANSKYGASYNGISNAILVPVSRGCGLYVNVSEGYPEPIMKRAAAFVKLNYVALLDAKGRALKGAKDRQLYAKTASVQDTEDGWALMQEFYAKNSSGAWKKNDIQYEVLTDQNGSIITDVNNDPIYTL